MERKFKDIRVKAFKNWLKGLQRTREEGELSDDYGDSYICRWQDKYTSEGKHCSVLCSIADWLDNISDLLTDSRYDNQTINDSDVLFRFYTKVLLIVSEIIEDFIGLHATIKELNKKNASRDIEIRGFEHEELLKISHYINSVCKHKIEKHNYHVHNHHLTHEFEDFGAMIHENQIRLDNLSWESTNHNTTILLPQLEYFTETVIKLNKIFDELLANEPGYKKGLEKTYVDDWYRKED